LGRFLADTQTVSDFLGGPALEEAEQKHIAVRVAKFGQSMVEMRSDLFPVRGGFRDGWFKHSDGLLFTGTTTFLRADRRSGLVAGGDMQPTRKRRTPVQSPSYFRGLAG
jgi:hypothetical protein